MRWIAAPDFGGNEIKAQRANLLNQIIIICLMATALVITGVYLGGRIPVIPWSIGIAWFFVLLLIRWVFKSGKLITAEVMLTVLFYVFITLANISLGTIRTPTAS